MAASAFKCSLTGVAKRHVSLNHEMSVSLSELALPISDFAIIVNPRDNVAVVKKATSPDLQVSLPDETTLRVRARVPPGHRFATRDIPAGEFVRQYGQPIGTSLGIRAGDQITHANMSNDVPIIRDLPESLHTLPPEYIPEAKRRTFMGHRRRD